VQVDEEVVAAFPFVFGVVAALKCEVSFVFELEVHSAHRLSLDEDVFGTQVAGLVEVARGSHEDLGDFLHVGGDQVHANVYYNLI
jgi:hypothetical protein